MKKENGIWYYLVINRNLMKKKKCCIQITRKSRCARYSQWKNELISNGYFSIVSFYVTQDLFIEIQSRKHLLLGKKIKF